MIKFMLAFLFSVTAFAGLPPTTLSGALSTTSKPTTFNFLAPFLQTTQVSGINSRVETGYENLLKNPQFEAATLGWTSSGGGAGASVANTTTDPLLEKQSMLMTDGASGGLTAISPSLPSLTVSGGGLNGLNGAYYCRVRTDSTSSVATTFTMSITDTGGTPVATSQTFSIPIRSSSTAAGRYYGGTFVFPSFSPLQLRITDNTPNAVVQVDDCYVGPNTNVFSLNPNSDWAAYTPTITGFGTVSNVNCNWRRDGADLLEQCTFTSGTPTAVNAVIGIPSGLTTSSAIAANQVCGDLTVSNQFSTTYFKESVLCQPSSTGVNAGHQSSTTAAGVPINASVIAGTGSIVSLQFRVPIAGWSAQNAISAQTSLQSWSGATSYASATLTSSSYTGFTVTTPAIAPINPSNMTCTNTSSGAGLQCTPTSAGIYFVCATATFYGNQANYQKMRMIDEASTVLQTGANFFTAGSADYSNMTLCATKVVNSISTNINFILQGASAAGPITLFDNVNWSVIQLTQGFPSPVLTGNVVQPDPQAPMMKQFFVGFSGGTFGGSVCSSSPCTINYSTYSAVTVTLGSPAGTYTVNVPSGVCTKNLLCTSMCNGGANTTANPASSSSVGYTFNVYNSGANANATCSLNCGCQ